MSQPARSQEIAHPLPRRSQTIDALWILRQSLAAAPDVLKPGCGWLPRFWMPEELVRQSLRQAVRDRNADVTGYGPPQGSLVLRQLLSRHLADRGIDAPQNQIVLTESCTQSIDLICRLLLVPGDAVLVDDPCFYNYYTLLQANQATAIGVPYHVNGPDPARLEQEILRNKPKLYITSATIHNPTGATLSRSAAHRVLELVNRYDLTVIEDDIFGDFGHEPVARLAACAGLDRIIYVGGFSKTVSPNIRSGFIVAKSDVVERLTDLLLATHASKGLVATDILHRILLDGAYRRHMTALRAKLGQAMGLTIKRLRQLGIEPWIEPMGGFFVWARLPDQLSAETVAQAALAEHMVLAPGTVFSRDEAARSFMRFNIAECADRKVFERLAGAMARAKAMR